MTDPARVVTRTASARPAPRRAPERGRTARPPLRVVDPAVHRRRRRARLGVRLGVLAAAASLLAVVVFHVLLAEGQIRLQRLQQDTVAQQARYEKLRLEVADRSAPQQIVQRALQLGLVPSDKTRYVSAAGVVAAQPSGTVGSDPASPTSTEGYQKVKPRLDAQP